MQYYHAYNSRQDYPMGVKKIQRWKKLFYAIFISMLTYSINFGDPKTNSIARHFQITDQKIQYIFETTIAIETKTIRKRISEQSKGVWTLINGMILGQNWADIEVKLKTRIGIKLNSITYDGLTNNVHVNFGDPCILDRTLKTKVIKTSDNFLKWSIQSYQRHKQKFEEELTQIQSKQIMKNYRSNSQKTQSLQKQYYGKIMQALQHDNKQFSVESNIIRLNQLILSCVTKFMPMESLRAFRKAYQYERLIKPYPAIQNMGARQSNLSSTNSSNISTVNLLQIDYLKEQEEIDYLKQQTILNQQKQITNSSQQNKHQRQIALPQPKQEQIEQQYYQQKKIVKPDIVIKKPSHKSVRQKIFKSSNKTKR